MWRHEDVWRTLGGGINFVTGEPLDRRVRRRPRSGKVTGGHGPALPGPADPRQRAVGRPDGAVRRRHGGAAAPVRPGRGLGGGAAPQGQRDRADRRRDGPADDRGLPRRQLRRVVAVRRLEQRGAVLAERSRTSTSNAAQRRCITDAIGSSETGFMGIGMVDQGQPSTGVGGPRVSAGTDTIVIDEDNDPIPAGSDEIGRLARGGHVPLGYYKDPEKTARLFAEVDGKRYTVPGDFARHEADGTHHPARPRQHVRQHRRREGLPRGGRGRADVAPGRLRRRSSSACPTTGSASASRPWSSPGPAPTPTFDDSAPTPAARSPATRCRAASGSSTRCSGSPTGKADYRWAEHVRQPTTRGTALVRTAALRPARHRPPDLRLHPVRARRRGDQPGRRPRRARLRALQRRRRARCRPELDGREHRRQAVRRRHRHAGQGARPRAPRSTSASTSRTGTATFVEDTLRKLGVPPLPEDGDPARDGVLGWLHSVARAHVDVALQHPIKLIANALGSPPKDVIDLAHAHGVPGRGAGRQGQARPLARRQRRRHRDRPGHRGGRAHRRDRHHGAGAGDRRRGRRPTRTCSLPAASAPAARSPPRSRSAPAASGWARTG